MPELTPEQRARQQIDPMLIAAGWFTQDYKAANRGAANGIALRKAPLKSASCDYVLLVDRVPVGVFEAEREGAALSSVADQPHLYAENLPDLLAVLAPPTRRLRNDSTGVGSFFHDEGRSPSVRMPE